MINNGDGKISIIIDDKKVTHLIFDDVFKTFNVQID